MRRNGLKKIWDGGGTAVNGWLSIPSSYAAEVVAAQGLDAVTVDLQHGMIAFDAAVPMLQAISATGAVPLARVSKNDPALVMQLLDAGAYGIICPMISTPEEAKLFADACRYPPRGNRSFGPARGLLYGGPDYFDEADGEILALAMIETAEGMRNLEAILATPGLDGIYVGPNDLCLALGVPPQAESQEPSVTEAITRIVQACRDAGKVAGVFCSNGEAAAMRAGQGFTLVTPGNDAGLLGKAVRAEIAAAKGGAAGKGGGSGY
jgi:4-hydroxy-2-oxoheptanedioate aldolase